MLITTAQLKAIAGPGARDDLAAAIVRGWPVAVEKAKLTSRLRACHFLAQIMTETGGLKILSESGAYSAKRIVEIFGVGRHSAKVTQEEARRIAALPIARRGPVLFNRVYGVGNPTKMREFKNTGPNDGWLYRGGGMMQCTGKSNYAAMAKKTGLPLVEHPELLHQPDSAFTAAYLEWAQDGRCNAAADRDDVTAVRKVINGGTNGLAECRRYLSKAKAVLAHYDGAPTMGLFDASAAVVEDDPAPAAPINEPTGYEAAFDPDMQSVQARLKAMNYNPGLPNGVWGGMMAGAITGFINDRGLALTPPASFDQFMVVKDDLKDELSRAEAEHFTRPVTAARAAADPKTVAAVAPEVVPAKRSFWATFFGAITAFFSAVWQTIEGWFAAVWDFFTDHKDDLPSDSGLTSTAWEYIQQVPTPVWFVLAGLVFAALAWNAHNTAKKITTAVQSGARQ